MSIELGEVFGTFEVKRWSATDSSGHKIYECVCLSCGQIMEYPSYKLKRNPPCARCRPDRRHYKPEYYAMPEHHSYVSMINRCTVPTSKDYPTYGGRGITVCQAWLDSFEQFLADVGPRPEGYTLDRINYNGDYTPGNVRWAPPVVQNRNKRFKTQSLLHKIHFPKGNT